MNINFPIRLAVFLLLTARTVLPVSSAPGADAPKPNVLIIIADDMGFSDIASYGGEIETPNLDALARDGVRFTAFHNSARCWPTRSSLITGYYAPQTGSDPNRGPGNYTKWHTTLPRVMASLGYQTYHSGKWHVQGTGCESAHSAGFDHAYDMTQGWLYYTPVHHALDGKSLPRPTDEDGYFMDIAITDRMLGFLGEHFDKDPAKPFFAYLSFCGPHYPLKAPKKYIEKYKGRYDIGWDAIRKARHEKLMVLGFPEKWKLAEPEAHVVSPHSPKDDAARRERDKVFGFEDVYNHTPWTSLSPERQKQQAEKMEIHAAMVDLIDGQIGRVLELLKHRGQLDNTLVFFLSDNGADSTQMLPDEQLEPEYKYSHDPKAQRGSEHTALSLGPSWAGAANSPFRRHKIWVHEGGIATPLIARWPAGITEKPGSFVHSPGHVIDFLPTLVDAAGGQLAAPSPEAPPYPGKSLLPALRGEKVEPDEIYFKHDGNRALIQWPWKVVSAKIDGNKWELFNMEDDRTETANLAEKNPKKLRELVRRWTELDDTYKKQGGYTP